MRVSPGIVPGFFTMANMFCGFLASILAAQGAMETAMADSVTVAAQAKFVQAAWLIIAAAVLDALDGKLARLTESSSEFGVQYDSMADVISFGLAPSLLAYLVFFHNWGTIGIIASFMPLVFGSIRLARFNVKLDGFDKAYFEGIPIPAAATVIATFVVFNFELYEYLRWSKVFFTLILIVSLLMISNIRYEKMPNFTLKEGRHNRRMIYLTIVAVSLVVLFPQEAFFPLSIAYIGSGIGRHLLGILRNGNGGENEEKSTENAKENDA